MPELPEVETVKRGLTPVMEGDVIACADVRRSGLRWPFPDRMAERLTGQKINALHRRSKYILADLASGESLLLHLGMSGRMLISGVPQGQFHHELRVPEKHDHVVFDMAKGARVTFNDARRFGMIDLVSTEHTQNHNLLAGLGPEPLGNAFHEDYLASRLKGKKAPIKAALLDQRIVAGLGNIYVAEALYRSGISPKRESGKISVQKISTLVPAIRDVLSEAIEAGGSSLKDFRQADGELGYFQHSFRVYGREGGACLTPGCEGIIHRIVQSGRSSFYCPKCQR